jgi:N,N'-diacetylchitobiose transport system permease protein
MTASGQAPPALAAARTRRMRPGARALGLPYLLILPAVAVIVAVAGWPLVKIVLLSLSEQQNSKFALFHSHGDTPFVGFRNYADVLGDSTFWTVVLRTVLFTVANVGVSLILGTALAVLLNRVSNWARVLLTTVMLFVWAVPTTVSSQVFLWMFNNQFGVVNWLLDKLPGVHTQGHDWYADPVQGLAVVSIVVVWGALPLLAISLHAGLTQVPAEVVDAARVDGASAWQTFRNVTLPYLRPLVIVLTTLSIIWDFGVFNQIFFMRNGHPEPGYQTIGVYMYEQGVGSSRYNVGSTIAVLMMICVIVMMAVYIRQLVRMGEAE